MKRVEYFYKICKNYEVLELDVASYPSGKLRINNKEFIFYFELSTKLFLLKQYDLLKIDILFVKTHDTDIEKEVIVL